jgi:hypothetical protein
MPGTTGEEAGVVGVGKETNRGPFKWGCSPPPKSRILDLVVEIG